ncbi:TetR/AcrR family transcriptional regulator [Streptomyces canus]|uniref:TetR/AcrR family transcriptional regulator n=1 Tax=Streptomyces canus TaxID=58343 RepID=UPI003720B8BF
MPRHVDREQRTREIVDAALLILSEGGYRELTLRNLGKQLGGSITLVTHYFADRDLLLEGITDVTLGDAVAFMEELAAIEDPQERLEAVLKWFLPLDEYSLRLERARIALVAHQNVAPTVRDFVNKLDPAMRAVLRRAVEDFVSPEELDGVVDLLRSWTTGMALSAVEHPEIWTPEHQLATLDLFLTRMNLSPRYATGTAGD